MIKFFLVLALILGFASVCILVQSHSTCIFFSMCVIVNITLIKVNESVGQNLTESFLCLPCYKKLRGFSQLHNTCIILPCPIWPSCVPFQSARTRGGRVWWWPSSTAWAARAPPERWRLSLLVLYQGWEPGNTKLLLTMTLN